MERKVWDITGEVVHDETQPEMECTIKRNSDVMEGMVQSLPGLVLGCSISRPDEILPKVSSFVV